MKRTTTILLFTLTINCNWCFGASLENVLKAFFYTQNDSAYLILHESLYNATSGSYEKGNMRSQGYNSSRISVYNLGSGRLLVQKNMGLTDSAEACVVLGCSANNLWLYSNKYKSGLQSLNPLTLEKNTSQAKIFKLMNISIGRFIEPNWNEISKYYGYDAIQQKLIVTNTQFQQFYIDAETFATQPISEPINLNRVLNNYLNETAEFNDSTWELVGFEQTKLKCGKTILTNPVFLNGKFIFEQNELSLFKYFLLQQQKLTAAKEQASTANPIRESAMIDVLLKNSKNNIESLIKGEKPDKVLLQTNANSFYIYSRASSTDDAFVEISKITSTQFGVFSEEWATQLPGLFFNMASARETKKFKQYYGDFYPEFSFEFMQVCNSNLIVIYQQFITSIDTKTGKINWQFKLK